MAYTLNDLNADLRRDLETYKPKERKTFHRGTERHGKEVRAKNRHDRRSTRSALKRGRWE